ncbi:MAG: hypothetical protein JWM49_619 [Microbacteriaceae bacterium]|nr:hypothetical protein [Microbacteriaceae bacterium]
MAKRALSLDQTHPDVSAQWHFKLNGDLTPSNVTRSSDRKVWWLCDLGHAWIATPGHRTRGQGCSVCAGKQIIVGVNDLATTAANVASDWHPTLNGDLAPTDVTKGSAKRVWWRDELGHEWQSQINNRVNGTGCPYCANQQVQAGFNDLASRLPDLAAQWDCSKNADLKPEMVTAYANRKVWWLCANGHSWFAHVGNRANGNGCPGCAGQMVVAGENDMVTTHPALAAEWHPQRNGEESPSDVFAGLGRKVWWMCAGGHEWQATGNSRTGGAGCPTCAGQRVLAGFNDLRTRNAQLAADWHPERNGDLHPEMVTISNARRVWWLGTCGHEWQAIISSRTAGSGCPVCAGLQILPGFNDLATAEPALVQDWHPTKNGSLTPSEFARYSNKKVWWQDGEGHEWESTINNRSHGQGCPFCAERGFNPGQPGYVYFLEHTALGAFKVGITNIGRGRLDQFRRDGWQILNLELFGNGRDAAAVELAIKQWWRRALKLPAWLASQDMPRTGGWSETISSEALTARECIERIKVETARRLEIRRVTDLEGREVVDALQ